jgi:hypothetical protein
MAARLRAVEHAYRTAIERDAVFTPPEPTRASRSPEHAADKEIELVQSTESRGRDCPNNDASGPDR